MKKLLLTLIIIVATALSGFAQVAVNTDGSTPNSSAMLDVQSSTKGMLIPRMTQTQRTAIASPETGLMVYQTDATTGFYFYNGTVWTQLTDALSSAQKIDDLSDAKSDSDGTNDGSSVFLGIDAGANDDGSDNKNVGVGYQSLYSDTTGLDNTAYGYQSLYSNTTGDFNTASGYQALRNNTTGDGNTAYGYQALKNNNTSTAHSNTACGEEALFSNISGYNNTALGNSAFSSGNAYHNSTGLGFNAEPGDDNTVRIGNGSVSSIGGYANWSNVSDGRFKKNIQENVVGLEFIKKLRPVTYQLDMDALAAFKKTPESLRLPESEKLKEAEIQIGFIAQEVEQAAQSLGFDFHGVDKPKNKTSHYGLRYAEFVVPLVKAVQELETENTQLKAENTHLKEMLKVIEQRLEILENK